MDREEKQRKLEEFFHVEPEDQKYIIFFRVHYDDETIELISEELLKTIPTYDVEEGGSFFRVDTRVLWSVPTMPWSAIEGFTARIPWDHLLEYYPKGIRELRIPYPEEEDEELAL